MNTIAANPPVGAAATREIPLSRTKALWCVAGLMFFVLAASYFFLPMSLRLDEAQSLWQTSRSPGQILAIVAEDVHVPLYHELLRLWRVVVGDRVIAARALSLLLYTLDPRAVCAWHLRL
jgi:uncharacterized membrane protein